MEELDLDVAQILEYVGWAAVGLTAFSTLLTVRRARRWKPITTRLVVTAAVGTALTLGSLLWTHRTRVWLTPTLALVVAGMIAGWVTATGLSVRNSSIGAVAKRSVLWAAAWGGGLILLQTGAALANLDLVAPAVAVIGLSTGALLGVGIRLLSRSRKLPKPSGVSSCSRCNRPIKGRFCEACGTPAGSARPPQRPPPNECRQCRAPLGSGARFCSRCGVAVLQDSRR